MPDVSDLDRVARTLPGPVGRAGGGRLRRAGDRGHRAAAGRSRLPARMQRFARVLLVDEFQDLTPAHMLLIRLLTGPAGAVFAVGDDDQTIYGYAGATPAVAGRFRDLVPRRRPAPAGGQLPLSGGRW